jgi:enoyl-CoA hydratase/carnithine racemase
MDWDKTIASGISIMPKTFDWNAMPPIVPDEDGRYPIAMPGKTKVFLIADNKHMSSILFEIKNSVGFITLNKPDKLNSFNREMALLMQEKLDACKSNDIRCVFITGAGKAFSAGQDLAEVVDPNGPGMKKILSEHYNPIVRRIKKLEKPGCCSCKWCCSRCWCKYCLCAVI